MRVTPLRVVLLTAATLICFSANSLLTRGALAESRIDWASFTLIRLVTGALMLALLVRGRSRRSTERGSWWSGVALAGYAVTFTFAYTRIGAAVGALLLFGAVQATMIATGLVRGERPARIDWVGVALAIAGLLVLTLPGAAAPDSTGAALMIAGGICWGAYSLAGRGSRDPLSATAGNFAWATLVAVIVVGLLIPQWHLSGQGVLFAAASGSVASGLGYTLWYTVLPALAAWRAAVIQLIVPVLTAFAAALLLGESISTRLVAASALISAGVWLTVAPAFHKN